MPFDGYSNLHIDKYLTNMSVAQIQDEQGFGALKLMKPIPVQKQSDKLKVWDKTLFRTIQSGAWPNGGRPPKVEIGLDSPLTYYCEVEGAEWDLTDDDLANEDEPKELEKVGVKALVHQFAMSLEAKFIENAFATGIYTTEYDGVSAGPGATEFLQFSDSSSEPIEKIRAYSDVLRKLIGRSPNVLVMNQDCENALFDHPDILSRMGDNRDQIADLAWLARLFRVDKIITLNSVYNTSQVGAAESVSYQAGKHMLLAYIDPAPRLLDPSAVKLLSWQQYPIGAAEVGGIAVERFSERPQMRKDTFRAGWAVDCKVTAADAGVFLKDAVE